MDTGLIRVDEARAIAKIAALIAERRRLREGRLPGSPLDAGGKVRLAALDAELEQLWTELRQRRSPMRHTSPPSNGAAR
jgi:hypothetical protein